MFPQKGSIRHFVWLLVGLLTAQVRADSSSAENNSGIHDPPKVTPNFYDPNYHDDGRNHLRGPTAASSSSTISIMSPYAAASSTSSDTHGKSGGSSSGGTVMAIVDHFYGPNGEEQVKYTNPSQMDKEEFEALLASLGGANSPHTSHSSKPNYGSPPSKHSSIQYSPPSSTKSVPKPAKYVGAPLSSLYKSSSSPSYSSVVPSSGYSLPSLYKSSGSENSYSSRPTTSSYRPPAYSTIYKDPQYSPTKPRNHYSKGQSDYRPTSSAYSTPKDPILLHSSKEPSYLKSSPYYDSHQTGPKSISDAILSEGYPKGYAPIRGSVSNVIDNEDSYPYSYSPSYPPPPSHMSMSHAYQPPREYSSGSPYVPAGSLKAGLHALPVRYSGSHGSEYALPPMMHHEAYSSGFGGGYSGEEPSDPYSRPSTKGYVKSALPSPHYSSSSPSHSTGGHSLSSLYEPLSFDEMYNSPKAKPMYSNGGMYLPKPAGYGPPGAYALSYGPPVEYHLPGKGLYMTSSSPYGSPGLEGVSPKYKGPYRTVNTGPSAFASHGIGYGYGKPHGSHHDDEHKKANNDDLSLAKDVYEDEAKYIQPPSLPAPQHLTSSPPSSLPPHLLQQYQQHPLSHMSRSPPSPTGSHEAFHPQVLSHPVDSYLPSYSPSHHDRKVPHLPIHHPHHHEPRPHPNEISHTQSRPVNNAVESSEEIHHVHVFERGFFGKEKRLREKSNPKEKWTPVLRTYQFGGSGEGGHGSASMERDAHVDGGDDVTYRGRRHRPPPPSRRKPMLKLKKRPYNKSQEEDAEQGRMRPPHSHHSHHDKRQRS